MFGMFQRRVQQASLHGAATNGYVAEAEAHLAAFLKAQREPGERAVLAALLRLDTASLRNNSLSAPDAGAATSDAATPPAVPGATPFVPSPTAPSAIWSESTSGGPA
jgi:hypothetical protein